MDISICVHNFTALLVYAPEQKYPFLFGVNAYPVQPLQRRAGPFRIVGAHNLGLPFGELNRRSAFA